MQPVQLPEHRIETRRVADLVPADYNPRKISPKAMEGLKKSLAEFGAVQPIVVNERTGHIVGGHQRVKALAALGQVETTVIVVDLSLTREKALNVALNNPHISGEFDDGLGDLLDEINGEMPELFADLRLDELLAPVDEPKDGEDSADSKSLADRFGVPPFSVLDARQGYWQDRKRAWLALGIQSELGRGGRQADDERDDSAGETRRRPSGQAEPGGSKRPAMTLGKDGRTLRGDGKGRPVTPRGNAG